MKNFLFKNKLLIFLISSNLILLISLFATCFGMEDYETVSESYGIVNTEYLNMRTGSGINYDSITVLRKNEYVRIFGKIGEWYIIQNEKNQIGTAHTDYIVPTENQKAAVTNTEPINEYSSVSLTNDESELLTLINDERKKNNLTPLIIDENLQNVARLKAKDLVENNYFSHTSPTYGSPFEMLKNHNITYKIASENIAGNPSLSGALDSWISSESHKNNILNNDYNYTGIAVVDSIAYGKIIVELFIGK